MDDSGIVELYLNRDEAAIARTSEKYGQRLRSFSLGIVQDLQTAEECENDTYMAAWSSIPPHAPRDYFYAFLARSELSAELEQCIPGGEDLDRRMDDRALAEAINGFLGALSEEKRNLFLRRYWYLDSIAAIAKRYRFSQSKVKTTLFRTRNQFRDYLKEEGYDI